MKPKQSAGKLWKSIQSSEAQDDVDEVLAMSDAELDAFLVAHGGDPAKIRAEGEALAQELDARRDRLRWHDAMDAKLAKVRAAAEAKRTAPRETLTRAELFARIEKARVDPRFTAPVAALFRDTTPEASTDDELQALLDQIELLASLDD